MIDTLEFIVADPRTRRKMQEERWAEQNEVIWENQVTTLTNEVSTLTSKNETLTSKVSTLSDENAELRRLLQQAGIKV